jgi:predicted phosphoadenosine phosphosulfate sulfurtransferase
VGNIPGKVAEKKTPNWRHVLPRQPVDQDVYTLALERTAHVMDTFDKVIVSFSGGKDSTAVLEVALEVAHSSPRFARHLPLRAVFCDEEAIPFETEEFVRRTGQRDDVALEWYCIPIEARTACSRTQPFWFPWAPEEQDMWCRPLPPEALTSLRGFPLWPREARLGWPDCNGLLADPAEGNTAQLMGIRAAESLTRTRAVTLYKEDNYIIRYTGATSRGNVWKAYPIYDWTDKDVWTAPAKFSWDYNEAYDRMAMAGLSQSAQRCSPAFGEEPIQKLWVFKTCFPEVWDKMTARVPGAAAAARYARTELYGFQKLPDKPAGMAWPDWITHYVSKHGEKTPMVAGRVGDIIRRHYRKTGLPILPVAPCPSTGLSWEFLMAIAMRGDFRERRQESHRIDRDEQGRDTAKSWHRYTRELISLQQQGITAAELGFPRPLPADPLSLMPGYARETFDFDPAAA